MSKFSAESNINNFFYVDHLSWLKIKTGTGAQKLVLYYSEMFMRLWGWIWKVKKFSFTHADASEL